MQVKVSYDIDNSHKKVRFMHSSYYHQSNFTHLGCLSNIPFKSLRYLIKLHGDRRSKTFHLTPQFCYLLIIPSNGSIPGYQKVCAFGDWPKLLIFFKAFFYILHWSLLAKEVDYIIPDMNSSIRSLPFLDFLQQLGHQPSFICLYTTFSNDSRVLLSDFWNSSLFSLFK